jgi:hypothetical protein
MTQVNTTRQRSVLFNDITWHGPKVIKNVAGHISDTIY